MKIYDKNDLSNFFFIVNKGKVNLIKEFLTHINLNLSAMKEEKDNSMKKKEFGPWDSFGEISFYNGKKREEALMENFQNKIDQLADTIGGKVLWEQPLREARRG